MDFTERKQRFQKKRLNLLVFIREGLERRLAAVNASIDTLKEQIEGDISVDN